MMQTDDKDVSLNATDARLAEAAQWFLRVRSDSAGVEDLPGLQHWLEADSRNARAYRQVAATWDEVGSHASAPEIMIGRRDALEAARRAARGRWSVRRRLPTRGAAIAASILFAIVSGFAWFYSQRGVYETTFAERRALSLPDSSVVTLDARTRIRVDYRDNERLISLELGQARFDVAKDPTRPFRVRVGAQTVVALGTQFNVDLVADNVLVTMIEGHVAVTGIGPRAEQASQANDHAATLMPSEGGMAQSGEVALNSVVELKAGEGLRVQADGQAVVLTNVDVQRATAWQSGKIFFDNEPLASAVERVNRYSREQIQVDRSVADLGISGVFNAGDPDAFIEAVTEYFPVEPHRTTDSEIRLAARR